MEPKHLFNAAYGALGSTLFITQFSGMDALLQACIYSASILYIGSHSSLENGPKELLTHEDAMWSPVLTSGLLVALFLALKFLSTTWVNAILGAAMAAVGVRAVESCLMDVLGGTTKSEIFNAYPYKRRIVLGFPINIVCDTLNVHFTLGKGLVFVTACAVSFTWLVFGTWTAHNVLAVSLAIQAIRTVSVRDFKVSLSLLGLLFVYDIFWVFGTNVMVTVASELRAPFKIIFPTSMQPWKSSVLGLGDIVLPGFFIAMALRFDHSIHKKKHDAPTDQTASIHEKFRKDFYWIAMGLYHCGLAVTFFVMNHFSRAQPALLYLVPACCLALLWQGFRGGWKDLLDYCEEDHATEGAKETTKVIGESERTAPPPSE